MIKANGIYKSFGNINVLKGVDLRLVADSPLSDLSLCSSDERNDCFYDEIDLNIDLKEGLYISIKGDIRSLNKKNSDFVIESYVNATEITILDEEPETYTNDVYIKFAELYEFVEFRNSYNDDS